MNMDFETGISSARPSSALSGSLVLNDGGDVEAIHRRCAIYTNIDVVKHILDEVGWCPERNLLSCRLLEPSAGDARFVIEAARRLFARAKRDRVRPSLSAFADRIVAFEFHEPTALRARAAVTAALREIGVHHATAAALSRSWIRIEDFLLTSERIEPFTHVVGNPPYIRWSKIPEGRRTAYEVAMAREMIGGDLFVPFLDRSLEWLKPGARCGFLCSDRWRFMAFGRGFREKWLHRLDIDMEASVESKTVFEKAAGAYPTIFVARKRRNRPSYASPAVLRKPTTLAEAGFVVRVGPALGCTPAFVLAPGEEDVEPELLRPWITPREILEGKVVWTGSRVVAMHAEDGRMIDPRSFPRLQARLRRFETTLAARSRVASGAPWYRPIDCVRAVDWLRPKLLVPELAKVPRIALDRSGSIPSHGVYAIFAPDDDLDELYSQLSNGGLGRALETISPRVRGGYLRCYRRFLDAIPMLASRGSGAAGSRLAET